jgi:hypothetical protein
VIKNYYYLVSSLIEVSVDLGKKVVDINDVIDFCSEQLAPKDFEKLKMAFLFNDIKNITAYLQNKDFTYIYPAYYTEEEFRENLKDTDSFLPFMADYLIADKNQKRFYPELLNIDELILVFYQYLEDYKDEFIKEYYNFELNLLNFKTAFSLKKNNQPLLNKLIPYGDYYNVILKSNTPDFGLSGTVYYIDKLVEVFKTDDLVKIEKTIEDVRWDKLDDMTSMDHFTENTVISYIIKLSSVERWLKINEKKGEEMLNNLINKINSGVKFSEEFAGGKPNND